MLLTKRILLILLGSVMLLSLAGCLGDSGASTTAPATTAPAATVPTTAPATVDDGKVTYTVTVTDENGAPIPGAMVQLCKDTCMPGAADANGVATFRVVEDTYKVSFLMRPAGYTYSGEEQEFYFEDGSFELTIALKKAS